MITISFGLVSLALSSLIFILREETTLQRKVDLESLNTNKVSCFICLTSRLGTQHCWRCDRCTPRMHRHSILLGCIGQRKQYFYLLYSASSAVFCVLLLFAQINQPFLKQSKEMPLIFEQLYMVWQRGFFQIFQFLSLCYFCCKFFDDSIEMIACLTMGLTVPQMTSNPRKLQ